MTLNDHLVLPGLLLPVPVLPVSEPVQQSGVRGTTNAWYCVQSAVCGGRAGDKQQHLHQQK